MDFWVHQIWALLVGDLPKLEFIGALFVAFALVETRWPAEKGQGLRGRLRNSIFALTLVVGGATCMVWLLYLVTNHSAWTPALRESGGTTNTILLCAVYFL